MLRPPTEDEIRDVRSEKKEPVKTKKGLEPPSKDEIRSLSKSKGELLSPPSKDEINSVRLNSNKNKSYNNIPNGDSGDPIAKQREHESEAKKEHRQRIDKKSALLNPAALKESNHYFNDVSDVVKGMSDRQKNLIKSTIKESDIPDDRFGVMSAIDKNPELKDYVTKELSGNSYNNTDPTDFTGNINHRKDIEAAHEDVALRGRLIKRLEKQIKDNNKKAKDLRSESTNIKGNGKHKEQSGRFSVPHFINDEDTYKKSKQLLEENDVLNKRLDTLKKQQLYLTGSDSDRQEIDESGFQKTIEEAGKGIGRGFVNLPKSLSTIRANLGFTKKAREKGLANQKKFQDINDSETLAMDKDLQGKSLSSVSASNLIPYLAGKVGESAPTMVPGLGVGKALEGAGVAAQFLGAGLSAFPIETAGQLEDAQKTARKEGRDVTSGDKWLAVGSGFLAALGEGLGDVALLKNISKGLDATGIDAAAKEAAKKEIGDGLARVAINASKSAAEGVATESTTEGVQQVIENAGAKYGWDNDRGYFNGVMESMAVGGILGGGVSGGVSAVNETINENQNKKAQKDLYDNNQDRLGTPFKSNAEELLGTENTQDKPQEIDPELSINYDPEAPVDQQRKQLSEQRDELKSVREIREASGEPTEGVDALLGKVDEIEQGLSEGPAEKNNIDSNKNKSINNDNTEEDFTSSNPQSHEFTNQIDAQDDEQQNVAPDVQKNEAFTLQEQGPKVNEQSVPDSDNPLPAQVDSRYESFIDTDESETPQIKVRKTDSGKEVNYRSNNRKGVIVDYVEQGGNGLKSAEEAVNKDLEDPSLNEQEKQGIYEDAYDSDGLKPEFVLKESNDPAEISEAIEKNNSDTKNKSGGDLHTYLTENIWSDGNLISPNHIGMFYDLNKLDDSARTIYNRKATKAKKSGRGFTSAEDVASEAGNEMGREVSPEEVAESFVQYQVDNAGNRGRQYENILTNDLAQKFKDITGQKYTPAFGREIIDAKAKYKAKESEEVDNKEDAEQLSKEADNHFDSTLNISYNELLETASDEFLQFLGSGTKPTQEELDYGKQKDRPTPEGRDQVAKDERGHTDSQTDSGVQEDEEAGRRHESRGFGSREDEHQARQYIENESKKQSGQLNAGIDPRQLKPKLIKSYLKVAGYSAQRAGFKFADFAADMVSRLGESVKPYLRDIYKKIQSDPRFKGENFDDDESIDQWVNNNNVPQEYALEVPSGEPTNNNSPQEGTPQKKASDGALAAFQKDIAPHTEGLVSDNIEVATRAAEQATQQALDNGVTSYLEYQQWVQQSTNGDINYQALQDGWQNIIDNDVNQNKLDINNKKGTLWTKTKNIADGVRFSVTKAMAVYNQRVRDVETQLEDIFGKDYFSGENSKYIMSWAMDRVSGQIGAMIDDFINPNKSYSVLSKIIRDMGSHPNINTSDFNEIDGLYKDLAEANRKEHVGTARKIEEKIKEITKSDDLQQWMIAQHAIESNEYSQNKNREKLKSIAARIGTLEKKLSQLNAFDTKTELQKSKERQAKKDLKQEKTERLNILQPLGVSTQEANDIIDSMKERGIAKDLDAIAGRVRQLDDRILTMAVENGVVSKQDAKNMREVYKYHIPANRKLTDDTGNLIEDFGTTGGQNGDVKVYSREGSQRVIGYALGNVVSNFQDMVQYSYNNKAKEDIAASIERETGKNNFSIGKVVDASNIGNTSEDNITGFTRPEMVKEYDEDGIPHAIEQIVDKAIVWADPEMAKAVNKTDVSSLSGVPAPIRNGLRAVVNIQRLVLTGANPSFILTNPLRDIQDATLNVGNRTNNKNAWKVLKDDVFPELQNDEGEQSAWNKRIFAGQRAILAYERGNKQGNELVQAFDELKHAGGTSSFYRFRGTDHIVDEINNRINKVRELQKSGHLSNAKAIARNTIKAFELYNEVMENATRLAVYKTLRDDGKTIAEAARLGKEATINFDMQGTWSPFFKMAYVFFQPNINAITSFGKGLAKPKNFAKSTGLLIAYGMAMAAYNDEMKEDGNYYKDKQSHPWKYNSNHVLTIPGIDNDITLPMGYTMSMFTGFGGHLYDYLRGYSDFSTFAKRSASLPLNVYNPLGGSQAIESGEDFASAVTPTALKPFAEVALNTSFFGPIYNKRMDADDNIPDYLLRSSNDRWVSTMLSNWLAKHSIADMSPKTFDHYINFVEGGIGKDIEKGGSTVIQFSKAASNGFKNNDGSMYYGPAPDELPILRRFVDDADPARIAYNSIWNRTEDIGKPLDINSDEFETQLKSLQKDYDRAKESGIYQKYQIEALDGAIARYIKDNYQKSTIKQSIREIRKKGWTGSKHKDDRKYYYQRQNIRAKEAGMRFIKWEDGHIKQEFTKRRKGLTENMIKAIEIKMADITNTESLK